VSLQQKLAVMQADPDHTLAEVLPLQEQLDMIDAERWAGGQVAGGWAGALAGGRWLWLRCLAAQPFLQTAAIRYGH
jgi:hypothetical protein